MEIDPSTVVKYGLAIALLIALLTALIQAVLNELVGSNIRAVIEERGWDKLLPKVFGKLERLLFHRRPFWFVVGALLGATVVAWVAPLWKEAAPKALAHQNAPPNSGATTGAFDWNAPAGPHSGPLGPIAAIELFATADRLPKSCFVQITKPKDGSSLSETIRWILADSRQPPICTLENPETIQDINAPQTKPTNEAGIVVHWNQHLMPEGQDVARFFSGMGLIVRSDKEFKSPNEPRLIWIDIGPGDPWKR